MKRSTLIHLRIPFSYYLSPIFFFAVSLSSSPDWRRVWLMFVILHLFLFPATNGFNSYYDRDTGSIGGIEHPPPVSDELLWASLAFDAFAVVLGLCIDWRVALAVFVFGLGSKAYSYTKIRIKRLPVVSWIGVVLFQGAFVFLISYYAVNDVTVGDLAGKGVLIPALLSSAFLMAAYPMTQIYQHEEDRRRGDVTLSILLGIRGTFAFSAIFFAIVMGGFALYYHTHFRMVFALLFLAVQAPVLVYFNVWFFKVLRNEARANYRSTMKLNLVSSTCLNIFFVLFYVMNMK
jgi:1,4-dihydroxy-2-naphthoate octaprenyltransferase